MARWLAGDLGPEEREEFENSPEFRDYEEIVQGLERFKKPTIDTAALKQRVMAEVVKKSAASPKVIRLKPIFYAMAVAASILLIVGLFFNKVTYSTGFGERLIVDLPDGSVVQLNAASEISRNRFFWSSDKEVKLSGEAFFEVEKGDGFQVTTQSGTVSVLGTKFNVRSRTSNFELACYEGKVGFEASQTGEEAVLVQGDAIKLVNSRIEKGKLQKVEPSWIQGRSTFSNVMLYEVIKELEAQYGIEVQFQETMGQGRFTGSFVHNDLDVALKSVFPPMGLNYQLSNDGKTVLLTTP